MQAELPSSPPSSRGNLPALAAVSLAALMFGLEISSVPVILPQLERLMQGSLGQLQWIMNAYTLACTTVLMAAGTLADRYGRKRLFLLVLGCFGLTSLACGLASGIAQLVAARFLQGMSGGAMLICLLAILSAQFREARERGRAFALFGIVFGAGLGFGPLAGAAIVALAGWQWVFLVHVPLSVLTLLLAGAGVRESRDPQAGRLDLAGIASLSACVFCVVFFITQQGAGPGGKLLPAVALASLALFIRVETRHPRPMFDFSVFRIRRFSGALFGSVGMNFSFWPLMIYLPIYCQGVLGYGVLDAGLFLLAYTLPTLVVPPLAERLALRYQASAVIPAGLFALGAGFLLMWCGSTGHLGAAGILPGCLLAGAGLGLTNTPVTNTATGAVPASRAGMASGIDMSARLITLAVNISVMGALLRAGVQSYLGERLPHEAPAAQLHGLAEAVAAGSLGQAAQQLAALGSPAALAPAALAHGFGVLMLYGGIGAWVMAALSALAFGGADPVDRAAQAPCG